MAWPAASLRAAWASWWRARSPPADGGIRGCTRCPHWWGTSNNVSMQTAPSRSHGSSWTAKCKEKTFLNSLKYSKKCRNVPKDISWREDWEHSGWGDAWLGGRLSSPPGHPHWRDTRRFPWFGSWASTFLRKNNEKNPKLQIVEKEKATQREDLQSERMILRNISSSKQITIGSSINDLLATCAMGLVQKKPRRGMKRREDRGWQKLETLRFFVGRREREQREKPISTRAS